MNELPADVLLTGKICTGKDYIGDLLVARRGFWRLGVGALIAAEIEQARGLPPGHIYSDPATKNAFRAELQAHGNKRRAEDDYYWVKSWWRARDVHIGQPAVATSGRFIYEAEATIKRGGIVVRVVCPENVRQERIAKLYPSHTAATDTNAAEAEITKMPYNFEIHGTLPGALCLVALDNLYRLWVAAGKPLIVP